MVVAVATILIAGMVSAVLYFSAGPYSGIIAVEDKASNRAAWNRLLPLLNPPGRTGTISLGFWKDLNELDGLLNGKEPVLFVEASTSGTLAHLQSRKLDVSWTTEMALTAKLSEARPRGLIPLLYNPWFMTFKSGNQNGSPYLFAPAKETDTRSALLRLVLDSNESNLAVLTQAQNTRVLQPSPSTWSRSDARLEFEQNRDIGLMVSLKEFRDLPLELRMTLELQPLPRLGAQNIVSVDFLSLAPLKSAQNILGTSVIALLLSPAIQSLAADLLGMSPVNPGTPLLDATDRLARNLVESFKPAYPLDWTLTSTAIENLDKEAVNALLKH